ncbi:MAB_1171c family putative transporter [Streptomyces sp. NPDC047130]|uniref:MAB_1171c family putative transporter n=1 Tax=Streptomyces sp. NPDC047130 TaxID=3155261 RepID=UPI0033E674B3
MNDLSYYVPALAMTVPLVLKGRSAASWRDPLVRSVCALLLLTALAFAFAAPPTIVAVNRLTGVPNVSAPLVYALLTAVCAAGLVLIVSWRGGPPGVARRLTVRCTAGFGAVIAVMVVLFALGDAPVERLRDFDTYYATTPFLREMVLLYLLSLLTAGVAMNVLCLRWRRRVGGRPLRSSLLLIALGFGLCALYAVAKLVAVGARWAGGNLDGLSTWGAPALAALGGVLSAAGFALPLLWSLPARLLGDVWLAWRSYHALTPLWRELRPVCAAGEEGRAAVRLGWWSPPSLRAVRRQAEIHDALLVLCPHFDPVVRERARAAAVASGAGAERAGAQADAVMVLEAVRAHGAARDADTAGHGTAVPPAEGPEDLVRLSLALRALRA